MTTLTRSKLALTTLPIQNKWVRMIATKVPQTQRTKKIMVNPTPRTGSNKTLVTQTKTKTREITTELALRSKNSKIMAIIRIITIPHKGNLRVEVRTSKTFTAVIMVNQVVAKLSRRGTATAMVPQTNSKVRTRRPRSRLTISCKVGTFSRSAAPRRHLSKHKLLLLLLLPHLNNNHPATTRSHHQPPGKRQNQPASSKPSNTPRPPSSSRHPLWLAASDLLVNPHPNSPPLRRHHNQEST